MRKRRIAAVIAAAVEAFTLFSTQASAITWEKDFATDLSPSSSGSAVWSTSPYDDASAAFQENGDWFFVADNRADGFPLSPNGVCVHNNLTTFPLELAEGSIPRRYQGHDVKRRALGPVSLDAELWA